MTPIIFAQHCTDEEIRCEEIHWLGCQCFSFPERLKEIFEDIEAWPHAKVERLLKPTKGYDFNLDPDEFEEGCWDFETLIYDHDLTGFLVQISTPIPTTFDGDGDYQTNGFGYYTTEYFYTEAFDAAFMHRVINWKTDFIESQRKKFLDKTK